MPTQAEITKRNQLFQPFSRSNAKLLDAEQTFLTGFGRQDGNKKAGYEPFNSKNPQHKKIVEECTLNAKKSLEELQAIDFSIVMSGATAFITFTFIPLWTVSVISTFLFARNLTLRAEAAEKQQLALKNLMTCWDWAQNHADSNPQEIMNDKLIIDMRQVMYPLIDRESFDAITYDSIEDQHAIQAEQDKNKLQIAKHKLDQHQLGVLYKIYGYGQDGGWLTFICALGYSFPGVAKTAFNWAVATYNSFTAPQGADLNENRP